MNCTIYETLDYLAKRWSLLIILEIHKGDNTLRYSEIKKRLKNITPKILSARLKELEEHGLIKKDVDASSFPIKCTYSLTGSGKDMIKIIKDIKGWALKWNIKNKKCKSTDCSNCTI